MLKGGSGQGEANGGKGDLCNTFNSKKFKLKWGKERRRKAMAATRKRVWGPGEPACVAET